MTIRRVIGVIVAITVGGLSATADAAQKNAGRKDGQADLRAIQLQCFKEHGAYFDAATKSWMIQGHERDMQGRVDAVHDCVKQRSGISAPFVRQEVIYR